MLNGPFSPWPAFDREEVDAVAKVISSGRVNYWTGTECREFEKEFAAWCGSSHAVSLSNGTLALDVALKALGVGPGDEVVVTPRTFIASVSCVVNAGATPVFADIDRDSGNISAATIARVITRRTRAIVPVHLAGWPCDMDAIMALAKDRNIVVVEDCAQAHGARYKGRSVGTFGQIGAWSFCQDKIITTGGEGGMVTTDDRDLWARMWAFKDHGKSFDVVKATESQKGFRWLHESFGTNWRMLEVQAAIGRIQLRRLADWTARRNANAAVIREALQPFAGTEGPVRVPDFGCADCSPTGLVKGRPCCTHGQYKFYVYARPETLRSGWNRDRIVREIAAAGVPVFTGSCSEVYLEKAFEGTGWRPVERLPVARELGETSIMFLVHPTLTPAELEKTRSAVGGVLSQASLSTVSA
jgi:dTDP-4-amino-4,6-dideoxygalactose transaminase